MRVLATKVPDDVYEAFRERANAEGLSMAALLRRLVYEYLGLDEGKPEVNRGLPSREEVEELRERVAALEDGLKKLEAELKRIAGISYYINRRGGKPR